MKKRLPIGINDFKKIIDENYYFVDKTLFIKELIDRGAAVTLLPRPRRFGKTLNMHMIQCFFEYPISRPHNLQAASLAYLFHDKKVWTDERTKSLQGKLPTITLTFKGVKATTWDACYAKIIDLIADEYRAHHYLLEGNALSSAEKETFIAIKDKKASQTDYENSLKHLSAYLQRYYQTEVLVLVDEYDAPIHAGYLNKFYQNVVGFIRGLFEAVFKDNRSLKLGVITGILRTAKEGIFSGLNNLAVYSLLDEHFADKFGFTQDEVEQLLTCYDMQDQIIGVKQWYDGYIANKIDPISKQPIDLYNPWSLLNFVEHGAKFAPYWANTSDNALVKKLLTNVSGATHKELERLLSGQVVERKVSEGLIFPGIERDETAIWSLLLFSGYLTSAKTTVLGNYTCQLKIPNLEIQGLYQNLIQEIFIPIKGERIDVILRALVTGDVDTFHELFITFFASMMSFYDIPEDEAERSYHLFVLGMLTPLGDAYDIRSNRESGQGRYDIMLIPHDKTKLGIIMEFKKVSLFRKETLESAVDLALEQINTQNYVAELRAQGITSILAYGIAVHGKQVLVKAEQLH